MRSLEDHVGKDGVFSVAKTGFQAGNYSDRAVLPINQRVECSLSLNIGPFTLLVRCFFRARVRIHACVHEGLSLTRDHQRRSTKESARVNCSRT